METTLQVDAGDHARAAIATVLAEFGDPALSLAARSGVRVVHLARGETYSERSPALRRLASPIDGWPVPPAGLFVVEERTVYLRSTSPMTVAHEFAHALDCALGGGVYLSGVDPRVRRAFRCARAFVTPYAATGLDEYFAECLRAWVGANDPRSPWPRATRERLRAIDPAMSRIVESLFVNELAA
ncbi:MAG TPA: hypothetical protein VFB22_04110 [Candidatus Baltobacteraceae bacterium]|nr:hypothetical protein [Candidatus Baltobacteraceae bacterium]